jgi:hypothetical protein
MKTIFINIPANLEIRNYLRGDFFDLAQHQKDVRFVVFVEEKQTEGVRAEFQKDNFIIEPLPDSASFLPRWILWWQLIVFASIPTKTIRTRQRYAYLRGGSLINYAFKRGINWLAHFRIWKALINIIEYYIIRDDRAWDQMFKTYKPDLVFATSLTLRDDTALLKAAQRKGVKTLGMTRSWDNLTSKLFLSIFPDVLLVQCPNLAQEATEIYGYPSHRIHVTGFQQWSHYKDEAWYITKEKLGEMLGVDPNKKWITYFSGPPFTQILEQKDYGDHLVMLQRAVQKGKIKDAQLIAKVHPIDQVFFVEEIGDIPVLRFGQQFHFHIDDMKLLMNLLRHSSVVINFCTSITLEAAILNIPIISLGWNGFNDADVPWEGRLDVAYDNTTHIQNIFQTGGVKRVRNEQELITAVNTYLDYPEKDIDGRKQLVEKMVGPVDGQAGQRILDALLGLLK